MRIVYHLGVHCTDNERLLRCLLKNRGVLAEQSIVVPDPARYRNLLRDTAISLKGQPASLETQAIVLDQIMDEDQADRLVLSWDNFLSFPKWAVRGSLYPSAGVRIRAFTQIFPQIEAEFHLAIRNPATFLPDLFLRRKDSSFEEFLDKTQPEDLHWSDMIRDILAQNPGVPLTVWCDEDTPLIWPEVVQAVSGHAPGTRMADLHELLRRLMTDDGLTRMQSYLDTHPPTSVIQRRRIVSAFLDKFAVPEMIEMEVDLPGWTEDLVERITRTYEADAVAIAAMPGVTFLEA